MKFLPLDQDTLRIIDKCFNSNFSHYSMNNDIVDLSIIFPWRYDFNSDDIEPMFEELKSELSLSYYVPKNKMKSPIIFLNYVMNSISSLKYYYLKPSRTHGLFRKYYLEVR